MIAAGGEGPEGGVGGLADEWLGESRATPQTTHRSEERPGVGGFLSGGRASGAARPARRWARGLGQGGG